MGAAAVAILWAFPARADSFGMEYSAPSSCPNQSEFLEAVASRTEAPGSASSGEAGWSFRVEIRESDGVWHGALSSVNAEGGSDVREVEAKDCSEAFDALAIMAALAIDAHSRPEQGDAEGEPDAAGSSTQSFDEQSLLEQRAAEGVAAAAALQPPSAAAGAPGGEANEAVSSRATDREAAADQSFVPAEPEGWTLGGAASLRSGVSPELSFGGEAVVRHVGPVGWSLRFALGGATSGKATVSGNNASFLWMGGSVDGCRALPLPAISACLSFDAGAIGGTGMNNESITGGHLEWRPWVAIGPAMRFRLPITDTWGAELGLVGLYTLARARFVYAGLEDDLVHAAPPLVFAASLGLSHSTGN